MRATMDSSGNMMMKEDSSSDSDSSENVSVKTESQPGGISLKGEKVSIGDVAFRKEDIILVLLVLNMVMVLYE